MVAESLIVTSYTIGFISFFLTLLTWFGVYVSLITAMRSAPTTLPLILGNLRQEMLSERSLMKYRMKRGDQYHVFPGRMTHKIGNSASHAKLAHQTLKYMWIEFRDLEKKFVVKEDGDVESAKSDNEASGGSENVWPDEKHVGLRARNSRRLNRRESHIRSRMGVTEAGLSVDRKTYYNTDLWHRVLWWWKQGEVQSLSDRVQKMQIRRMERDMWETDELVKRGLQILGDMSGEDIWYSEGHEPHHGSGKRGGGGTPRGGGGGAAFDSDSPNGKGGFDSRRKSVHSRPGSGSVKMRRRPSNNVRNGVRDVYEKEFIRVRPQSQSDESQPTRTASIANRRPDRVSRGNAPSVVEYEIVHPPPVWVENGDTRSNAGKRSVYETRRQSYSRDRSPSRGRR